MTTENKAPETTIRLANISASVFVNKTEGGRQFRSVSVQRSYLSESGDRAYTNSFTAADMPVLKRVLDLAQNYVERKDEIVDLTID